MQNIRKDYFDNVKGLAIILVVIGHCIQYGSGERYLIEQSYFNNVVFRAIYSFHMPLFMLVSGFLFFYSCLIYDWKKLVYTKLTSLGIPIIAWGTVDFLIDIFSGNIKGSFFQIIKSYVWSIINAPWFLWATLLCTLCLILLRFSFKDKTLVYIVFIPIILILPDKYNMVMFKYMYPYFAAGYLWNKHKINEKVLKLFDNKVLKILIVFILIAFWAILLNFFNYNHYIYTTHMQIIGINNPFEQLSINLFRWLIGFAGSAMILAAMTYLKKSKILSMLGRRSLGIYLINIYVNLYLLKNIASYFSHSIPINAVETLFVLFICCVGTWLLEQNKLINRVFLGGRS